MSIKQIEFVLFQKVKTKIFIIVELLKSIKNINSICALIQNYNKATLNVCANIDADDHITFSMLKNDFSKQTNALKERTLNHIIAILRIFTHCIPPDALPIPACFDMHQLLVNTNDLDILETCNKL